MKQERKLKITFTTTQTWSEKATSPKSSKAPTWQQVFLLRLRINGRHQNDFSGRAKKQAPRRACFWIDSNPSNAQTPQCPRFHRSSSFRKKLLHHHRTLQRWISWRPNQDSSPFFWAINRKDHSRYVVRTQIHAIKKCGSSGPKTSQHLHEQGPRHHRRFWPCQKLHVFLVLSQRALQGSWYRFTPIHVTRRSHFELLQLKNWHLGLRHHNLLNVARKFSLWVLQAIKRPQVLRKSSYSR